MKILTILLLSIFLLSLTSADGQSRSPFDNWDKNKDGKLVKEELPAALKRNFERVDTNKDGWISRQEDTAFRQRGNNNKAGQSNQADRVKKIVDLDYSGKDNPRQKLDLYLPQGHTAQSKPLPVICWIHGGAWLKGDKANAWRMKYLVASGKYIGVSIGYRLSSEAQWPAQIHDCKAAIRYLKANAKEYGIDPERIGVWGSSAGGHLVSMLGVANEVEHLEGKVGAHLDQSSEIACVVDYYGPTALLTMNKQGSSMDHDVATSPESLLIGGAIQKHVEKARDASPIHHVTKDDKPVLIAHGTVDPLVPYQQSVEFKKALEKAGVEVKFITITNGGHGKGFPKKLEEIVRQYLDFHLLKEGESPQDAAISASKG